MEIEAILFASCLFAPFAGDCELATQRRRFVGFCTQR